MAAMASSGDTSEIWKEKQTNFNYIMVAAGILGFLGYVAIHETFFKDESGTGNGLELLGSITLLMLRHMLLYVPMILGLRWSFRFIPKLDAKFNPEGKEDLRTAVYYGFIALCIFVLLIPPAVLVMIYG